MGTGCGGTPPRSPTTPPAGSRTLALPAAFKTCRGKRLRLTFLNIAARVVTTGRRLILRLPRAYAYLDAFTEALTRIRGLPTFA